MCPLFVNAPRNQDRERFNNVRSISNMASYAMMPQARGGLARYHRRRLVDFTFGMNRNSESNFPTKDETLVSCLDELVTLEIHYYRNRENGRSSLIIAIVTGMILNPPERKI